MAAVALNLAAAQQHSQGKERRERKLHKAEEEDDGYASVGPESSSVDHWHLATSCFICLWSFPITYYIFPGGYGTVIVVRTCFIVCDVLQDQMTLACFVFRLLHNKY